MVRNFLLGYTSKTIDGARPYGQGVGVPPVRTLAALFFALAACSPSAPRETVQLPPKPLPPPPPPAALPTASAAASVAAPPPDPGPPFPPVAAAPPYERTQKPTDGSWSPYGPADAAGKPYLYKTTLHVAPIKSDPYVAVVAIDLRRVASTLAAGTAEPESKAVGKDKRPGVVPAAALDRLLAVHNGGFMAKHGKFGMRLGADLFVPMRDGVCDVGLRADGTVAIAEHGKLPDEAGMVAVRQTPPCLLEAGELHAGLADEKSRKWGAAVGGDTEVRRSALGLDKTGKTLFFGLGEWTTPKALATAMKAVGSVTAAELDINWSYTFFVLFERDAKEGVVVSDALVPKLKYGGRTAFSQKAAFRDFFYLTRRPAAADGGKTD